RIEWSVVRRQYLRPRRRLGREQGLRDVARGAAWAVETLAQRGYDLRRAAGAAQRHDRAAEPGAGEARPRRACLPGQLHEPVQLGVAHFVVVPQTPVRGVEQLSERRQLSSGERRL